MKEDLDPLWEPRMRAADTYRRQILPLNVTRHPTSFWFSRQLREAFPYDPQAKYLIYDRDTKFGDQVAEAVLKSIS